MRKIVGELIRRTCAGCNPLSRLQIQDLPESGINARHEFPGNLSNLIGKTGFVESHDLHDVGDRVLREPGACRWKQGVPGSAE